MGKACCGTPGVQTYQFNGKEQKIKIKDAKTIERFAAGGNARIQVKNKKIEMGKEIAGKYFFTFLTVPLFLFLSSDPYHFSHLHHLSYSKPF